MRLERATFFFSFGCYILLGDNILIHSPMINIIADSLIHLTFNLFNIHCNLGKVVIVRGVKQCNPGTQLSESLFKNKMSTTVQWEKWMDYC